MRPNAYPIVPCLLAVILSGGCASITSTAQPTQLGREKIAKPSRIIVHDFAATEADIPIWSVSAEKYTSPSTPPTAEQIQTGRKLGRQIAKEVVAQINAMGLTAVETAGNPGPRHGDIVIVGYLESMNEGSAVDRVVLGFGEGSASLRVAVEGYLMTAHGLRLLGSGDVDSGGGKSPGLIVPLVVTAATANPVGLVVGGALKAGGELSGEDTIEGTARRTAEEIGRHLQERFEDEGWI